ncbi:MAG TPA: heavy metal-responsive transcriptional regulator [Ktedonobacterales bacterium]
MEKRDAHGAGPRQMTIGALARRLGVHPRALRYYERIGLLVPSSHTAAGYRLYSERDAERATFIRRAQTYGLSLDEIAGILAVHDGGAPPCRHVRALADSRVRELDARLAELLALRAELTQLAESATQVEPICGASDDICLAFGGAAHLPATATAHQLPHATP